MSTLRLRITEIINGGVVEYEDQTHGLILADEILRLLAAQGIEAGTGETRNAARPEGREPGPYGMRPDSVCVCKACTPEAAA